MARLIDADALMERMRKKDGIVFYTQRSGKLYEIIKQFLAELLKNAPTVDAVEVVHGRWTEAEDGDGAVCSVCGEDFCNVYLEVERFLYCPNCGAKMDGDGNA